MKPKPKPNGCRPRSSVDLRFGKKGEIINKEESTVILSGTFFFITFLFYLQNTACEINTENNLGPKINK